MDEVTDIVDPVALEPDRALLEAVADGEPTAPQDDSGRPALAAATLRILVCGSRKFRDRSAVWTFLDGYLTGLGEDGTLGVISGMAPGADRFGYEWALEHRDVALGEFPADWEGKGRGAGFIRNQQMLDEGKPHLGLAFTDDLVDSRGTADMVRRLKAAKVPYLVVGQATPPSR